MSLHEVLGLLPSRDLWNILTREDSVYQPKAPKRQQESYGIGNTVEPLDAQWCANTHLEEKSIEVGCNGNQVDCKRSKIEAVEEVVGRVLVARVKHWDVENTASKEVVIADENTCDGAEEDLIRAEEVDKDRRR